MLQYDLSSDDEAGSSSLSISLCMWTLSCSFANYCFYWGIFCYWNNISSILCNFSHGISTCYNNPLTVMPGQFVTFDLFTSKIEKTYFQNKCHDISYIYPTCIIFVACKCTLISAHLMCSMYPLIIDISWWKYPTKLNILKNFGFSPHFL